jgi:hypothetical protein
MNPGDLDKVLSLVTPFIGRTGRIPNTHSHAAVSSTAAGVTTMLRVPTTLVAPLPTLSFYKAVPKRFLLKRERRIGDFLDSWEGIKAGGLDHRQAGRSGGATSLEQARTGRARKPDDRNHTWLTPSLAVARGYAAKFDDGVVLRIIVPRAWEATGRIRNRDESGWSTQFPIPACFISFECGQSGVFSPIAAYTGENAFIFRDSDSDESEGEWD